ncbi:AmmeMemoRadiSam system radical SAM enzyme, partial [Candidatus Hydrogenedentota bacterium]
ESQRLRENPDSGPAGEWVEAEEMVQAAAHHGCLSVTATWTEPTIFFEYALEIARLAHERGIANCWVSNGFMTPEAVDVIAPYLDAINVDLKSFNPETYQKTIGGRLEGVLETLTRLHEKGVWLEVATLVVPGMNDSADELRSIARFLADLGLDIPWHISGFLPRYKMEDRDRTPVDTIHLAYNIGREEGLRHIYTGKCDDPKPYSSTLCHKCGALLVERNPAGQPYLNVVHLDSDGMCSSCETRCAGVWQSPCGTHNETTESMDSAD